MTTTPAPPAVSALAPEGPSPLTEADPASVNDFVQHRYDKVMNTNPVDITDAELTVLIKYHRDNRARFLVESQIKASTARPRAPAASRAAPRTLAEALASVTDSASML